MSSIRKALCLIALCIASSAIANDKVHIANEADWCSKREGRFSQNLLWFQCDDPSITPPIEGSSIKMLRIGDTAYLTPWIADAFIKVQDLIFVSTERLGTSSVGIKKTATGFELWDARED